MLPTFTMHPEPARRMCDHCGVEIERRWCLLCRGQSGLATGTVIGGVGTTPKAADGTEVIVALRIACLETFHVPTRWNVWNLLLRAE